MVLASVTQEELRSRLQSGKDMLILDARKPVDFEGSSLKIWGAIRISPDEVDSLGQKFPKDAELIVYFRYDKEDGERQMVQRLRSQGFENVYSLAGGFQDWLKAGFEMEPR